MKPSPARRALTRSMPTRRISTSVAVLSLMVSISRATSRREISTGSSVMHRPWPPSVASAGDTTTRSAGSSSPSAAWQKNSSPTAILNVEAATADTPPATDSRPGPSISSALRLPRQPPAANTSSIVSSIIRSQW